MALYILNEKVESTLFITIPYMFMLLKRITALCFIAVFSALLVACGENGNNPKKGTHYEMLPADLSHLPIAPLTEIFSYTCGHCRNMEQALPEIEKLTGEKVGKQHVTYNNSSRFCALIYYSAVAQLGKKPDADMMEDLFSIIQSKSISNQQKSIELAFTKRGLSSPFQPSDEIRKKIATLISVADTVTNDGEINAVPTFIVKGKYKIISDGHKDIADLANTIKYLLSKQ